MKIRYTSIEFVEIINSMLPSSKLLQGFVNEFPAGSMILREFTENDCLYIILEGIVTIIKIDENVNIKVADQGPGEFLGMLSFQTGEPVFQSAKAKTYTKTLMVSRDDFARLKEKYPTISGILYDLIFVNLADRYRKAVQLHIEVNKLTNKLKKEKEQLKQIIRELEETRNILISQEKMAVLGQLTAGLAHEINNPASALLRSVEFLINNLPMMLERAGRLNDKGLLKYFFESGQKRVFSSSEDQRDKTRTLGGLYPNLKRSQVRILADMSEETIEKIELFAKEDKHRELFELYLEAFQAGIFINGIRLSTTRIEHLVKSLKSFSRQDKGIVEPTDIRLGIEDTLLMLGNRLKKIVVEKNFTDIPMVKCTAGEINQVWTNIIINACDAMDNLGKLFISCGFDGKYVWVKIGDSGPGVHDSLKEKIFESNFTTKAAGGNFGLGLGLAITKSTIEKHKGLISVEDREGGGAEFTIKLPAV